MKLETESKIIKTKSKNIKMIILRPKKQEGKLPGILWIHGGGYILGSAAMVHFNRAKDIAKQCGAVVVSPEYRLAKEAPYPAAVKDCYATLVYMKRHGEELGIDTNRIIVGGESAGGGLAIAVCMIARDKREVDVCFQLPLYPMIDCYDTESSRDNHGYIWNTRRNHYGWKKYLANMDRTKDIPAYASPSRQTDYKNLPPAYTFVCDGEPFYSETLTYIDKLKEADIDAKVDIYHGKTHAFDMMLPWLAMTKQARKRVIDEYRKQIH